MKPLQGKIPADIIPEDLLYPGRPYDDLLMETTGVVDPSVVTKPFRSDQDILPSRIMDRFFCLVDAIHFEAFSGDFDGEGYALYPHPGSIGKTHALITRG